MSITDELREYANTRISPNKGILTDIANHIDAVHEQECSEAWMRGHDVWASVGNEKVMAERGWVRLPKDADGEYIHIGDMMAYADNTKPMEAVALVSPAVFLTEDGPRYADMCRHYHAPTVEDVLEEYRVEYYDIVTDMECENIDNDEYVRSIKELNSKYAAKLRLAGDTE